MAACAEVGLGDHIVVDSAGTHVWRPGAAPDRRAQAVARRHGIELGHLGARQVERDDFRRFDYVVAMDDRNYADLAAICPPGYEDRLHRLLDFAPDCALSEIPDPFGAADEAFERTFDLIEKGVAGLLLAIRSRHFEDHRP